MKLIYLTSKIYPSSMANSIQTFWMAKTFTGMLGNNFLLILGRAENGGMWYGIPRVETGYTFSRFRTLYYLFWFPLFLRKHIERGKTVVYCRDFYLGAIAAAFKKSFGYKIAFEYHDPPFWGLRDWFITRFCDYLIPTTKSMKGYLARKYKIPETKFFVAPNGVNVFEFEVKKTQEDCREKLGLTKDKKIVLYSGHLYPKKGVHTLLSAALSLEEHLFVFIGGTERDIGNFRKSAKGLSNIFIAGHKRHNEIPLWLKSADILVAPQSAVDEAARYWACPIKIFEYMASGVPIIASDLPCIREILDESNASLAKPDDAADFAIKIRAVFSNPEDSDKKARKAYDVVQNYTWQKRAHNILGFIYRHE